MNIIIDIILAIPLVWALWAGFRNGVIVQVGGIVGLLLGVWLAFRYGAQVGAWFNINDTVDNVIGFVIIVVATVVVIGLIGRLLKGVFRFAGLAVLDRLGGALLSLLKVGLILGLLLWSFGRLSHSLEWDKAKRIEQAYLYKPLTSIAEFTFPYMEKMKDKLLPEN
jgi:membrane protein required for colicin V production